MGYAKTNVDIHRDGGRSGGRLGVARCFEQTSRSANGPSFNI